MSNSRKRKYSEEFQSSWGAQSEPCCMPLWEYGRGQEPCCQADGSCPPELPCPQPCPPEPPCPPPCPTQPEVPDFFAQYGVMSNPASGSNLAYLKIFNQGNKITLQENTVIVLPKSYLYQIDYLFLATPETNSYFQVVPYLNGSPRLLYAGWASSNSAFRNASTSGSFTTDDARNADALLSIRLTYPNTVRNIDISGAVSITPLQKL